MASVSVVIPCYEYGRFLPEAVGSVLNDQDGVDVRVLIIDDASRDDSPEAARAIAAREPRVDVVLHDTNKGHIATYNEGLLGWAEGDYCVLLSADDKLTPGALPRAVALLDACPQAAFAYGHAVPFIDGRLPPPPRTHPGAWAVYPGRQWLERSFRLARCGICSPEVVVRTSMQKRLGGYDPRLPHHGDNEMWLRLAAHADVGYLRGVDQAYYRRHGQNMSTGYDLTGRASSPLNDLRLRQLAFETVLERCKEQLPDPAHLADLVHRKLAWEALFNASRLYEGEARSGPLLDELVAFAFECWPDTGRLPAYRWLRTRRRLDAVGLPRVLSRMPSERASRFLSESRQRYRSLPEALDAVAATPEGRRVAELVRGWGRRPAGAQQVG